MFVFKTSASKKRENDKEPKSIKKHEGSCFLVHYGPSSSTQAYNNHEKAPKSTEKHQKAPILKEGEPAQLSHNETSTNHQKAPKCTKKNQKERILGGEKR